MGGAPTVVAPFPNVICGGGEAHPRGEFHLLLQLEMACDCGGNLAVAIANSSGGTIFFWG